MPSNEIDLTAITELENSLDMKFGKSAPSNTKLVGEYLGTDEDGQSWVKVGDNDFATPLTSQGVTAELGDILSVSVSNGYAVGEGNFTSPLATARHVETVASPIRDDLSEKTRWLENVSKIADEADMIAKATDQHFWDDDGGAHVTDVTKEAWKTAEDAGFVDASDQKPYHNILMNSLGILLRTALKNLVSITRSAIAFFDGAGNLASNVVASFGKDGAIIGKADEPHLEATGDGLAFYDGEGSLERHVVTRISSSGMRMGRVTDMHVSTDDVGFSVQNGTDTFFSVTGTPTGQPESGQDYDGNPVSVHALGYSTYTGDLKPYHVYGGPYDMTLGYQADEVVYNAHEGGVVDDVVVVGGLDGWVYVDTPIGEPNPYLWISTDGDISGKLLEIGDAALTVSAFAGQGVAFGASQEVIPPEESPVAWYERMTGDDWGAVYVPTGTTRTFFRFRWLNAYSGTEFVIASAYRERTATVSSSTDIYEGGSKLSDKYASEANIHHTASEAGVISDNGLRLFGVTGTNNPIVRTRSSASDNFATYAYLPLSADAPSSSGMQAANRVFATPDGSSGLPSIRALVADDIPNLDASKIGSGTLSVACGGTGAATASANMVFAGPSSGSATAPSFRALAEADLPSAVQTKLGTITSTANEMQITSANGLRRLCLTGNDNLRIDTRASTSDSWTTLYYPATVSEDETTIANIVTQTSTQSTNNPITSAKYRKRYSTVMVEIKFKPAAARSAGTTIDLGTIVSGKRPHLFASGGSQNSMGRITTAGAVTVIVRSALTANTEYTIGFTYLV